MLINLLIACVLIKNVFVFNTQTAEWQKTNAIIDKKVEFVAEEKKCKHVINGEGRYFIPLLNDFSVFLYGSPAGNIWEDEFIPEVQSKARKTLFYFGIGQYGILGAWQNEADINDGLALGPWIIYPDCPQLTPYYLEKWNPFVFISFKLDDSSKIPTLIDSLKKSDARGVILPLPDKFISETQRNLLAKLSEELKAKGFKIFGYSIKNISLEVQKLIKPDVIIGWIPDSILDNVRVLPLFFDTIPTPQKLVPIFYKISLKPSYAFGKVGIRDYNLVESISAHNDSLLKTLPSEKLLFGSGCGFIGRYFGYGFINTFNHWKSAGVSTKEILKVIYHNNAEELGTKSSGYALYEGNPFENPENLAKPLIIFKSGKMYFPPYLEYQIDSVNLSPLPIGKSDLIVDFKSDSTLWGTCWRCGNLGFGLSAQWQSNCIYGNFVSNYENMWSMGQVINLEGKFGQGWDLSPYNSITIVFDGSLSIPVNVSILNKYSYTPLTSGANAGDTSVTVILKPPYSSGVQGIKIAPSNIGQGSYKICLKAVKVNRDSTFLKKLITNLYKRVELGTTLSDTSILLSAKRDIQLANMLYNNPELKYLLAYADYRLIPITSSSELQKKLVSEGLDALKNLESIEAKILEYSLRGYEAGLSPLKAIFGSSKRNKLRKEILTKAYDNPRTYYVLGISRLFTPSMYGGSVEKAIENFQKSVELFESGKAGEPPYTWGYTDALIFLSIAYKKHGEPEEARKVLNKVSSVSPFSVYGYMQRLFE